ncbi:hypothetical protein [Corynebacterium bouchesdurhonense]|uniref:hypothetical protein n=1 Tax=Corynebacterium bouchesdurhonense TaxID=1720192 RepID=UPI000830100F|nr:hypothetical protein [Corynebacterium bouchesdurhonense]
MTHRLATTVVALAVALPLAACAGAEDDAAENAADQAAEATEVSATSTIGRPQETFEKQEAPAAVSTEIQGERVKDPAMDLSYKWQGTSYAPNGGTVVVVAVTNQSDAPMPADTLQPKLEYNAGNKDMREAKPMDAEAAGVDTVGLDLPLGPGATANVKYAFDVATGNLWDARFSIGNVTFEGNLNN